MKAIKLKRLPFRWKVLVARNSMISCRYSLRVRLLNPSLISLLSSLSEIPGVLPIQSFFRYVWESLRPDQLRLLTRAEGLLCLLSKLVVRVPFC